MFLSMPMKKTPNGWILPQVNLTSKHKFKVNLLQLFEAESENEQYNPMHSPSMLAIL